MKMNESALHQHLVEKHGVPPGFIETTAYHVGEWRWEHAVYHGAYADATCNYAGPTTRTFGPGWRDAAASGRIELVHLHENDDVQAAFPKTPGDVRDLAAHVDDDPIADADD